MTPSQLSEQLRRIASGIDNSKNPQKSLVMTELKRMVAALGDVPANAECGGVECVSLRDETREQAISRITKAFNSGWTSYFLDDGFMMFKPNTYPEAQDAKNLDEMIKAANDWFVPED